MDLDKSTLVNIVLLIHMALTGMMLFRLFKTKNATGKLVILSMFVLMIPIFGPFFLILYLNKELKKQEKIEATKKTTPSTFSKKTKRK